MCPRQAKRKFVGFWGPCAFTVHIDKLGLGTRTVYGCPPGFSGEASALGGRPLKLLLLGIDAQSSEACWAKGIGAFQGHLDWGQPGS